MTAGVIALPGARRVLRPDRAERADPGARCLAARDPSRQGFTGTELLLFGAILYPPGGRARERPRHRCRAQGADPADPPARKGRRLPASGSMPTVLRFRSAPIILRGRHSRPIGQIVDERTAAIYELGLDYPAAFADRRARPQGADALRVGAGRLCASASGSIRRTRAGSTINDGVLYQRAHRLAVQRRPRDLHGRDLRDRRAGACSPRRSPTSRSARSGSSSLSRRQAEHSSVLYGLFAVGLSVLMGWAAGRLFSLV